MKKKLVFVAIAICLVLGATPIYAGGSMDAIRVSDDVSQKDKELREDFLKARDFQKTINNCPIKKCELPLKSSIFK
jgi:hypothetical protein